MAEGGRQGLRVVTGCEFSVAAPWCEMHVLGYFLPVDRPELEDFLAECRAMRVRRAEEMVSRLQAAGQSVSMGDVLAQAGSGAVGRPHVARALLRTGGVRGMDEAFQRFIGRGRVAYVPKVLPSFGEVCQLVHRAGGLVSTAHLRDRGTRSSLKAFKAQGLDGVETRHPGHDPDTRARLTDLALELDLLRTGGSDWHGDGLAGETHGPMGSQDVPGEWLAEMEKRLVNPV